MGKIVVPGWVQGCESDQYAKTKMFHRFVAARKLELLGPRRSCHVLYNLYQTIDSSVVHYMVTSVICASKFVEILSNVLLINEGP